MASGRTSGGDRDGRPAAGEELERDLRALYEKYSSEGELPEDFVKLAQRVEEAYKAARFPEEQAAARGKDPRDDDV